MVVIYSLDVSVGKSLLFVLETNESAHVSSPAGTSHGLESRSLLGAHLLAVADHVGLGGRKGDGGALLPVRGLDLTAAGGSDHRGVGEGVLCGGDAHVLVLLLLGLLLDVLPDGLSVGWVAELLVFLKPCLEAIHVAICSKSTSLK